MLTYYINSLDSGMIPQPNENYRELQQARVDDQWENTSARFVIREQQAIGLDEYIEIEAWLNYVVGQTSSGMKNGEDFCQIAFQNIYHVTPRGLYYKFDDNIWLAYFTDLHKSLSKTIAVRRCNNALRWINPLNGALESVPCVVDYDMSSPSVQVSQSILTPNNHAVVMIQGNDLTNSQLKTNMRFMLGGRPFKLYGYQNAIMDDDVSPSPTLLYLDLYLDEIQANDDLPRQLAFNGFYNYIITPSQLSIETTPNAMGFLSANVLLNGESVIRPLVWESRTPDIIQISMYGDYIAVGDVGELGMLAVGIEGNMKDAVEIPVIIISAFSNDLDISINPNITKIRQYETIKFKVETNKHGLPYVDFTSQVSLEDNQLITDNKFLSIMSLGSNEYEMTCKAFDSILKAMYITVIDNITSDSFTESFEFKTVNMFG